MASAAIPTWENVYINGQWSRPSTSDKFFDVIDSNTGKVCARVPAGGAADVDKAVAAARDAFSAWADKSLDERKAIMMKVLESWQSKKAKAAEWLCKELGCTAAFANAVQVNMVDFHLGTSLKLVDMVKFEERMAFGSLVVREPIGVVGCITPWNYPLNQIAAKVFPAMLVGCTIVLKPSEVTPVCAYLLAEAVHEAGVPPGVFNMLMGDGPNCGEAIAAHPGVDMVSFTGSTRAGKRISEVGAQTLKVVRTELGGKSAALMLEDADLPKLVPKFMQTLMNNSGQSCNALSRMLVPRTRYDEAVELAKQVAEKTTVGLAQDAQSSIGPLSSQTQWDKVQGYIQTGIKEGARLVTGGTGKPDGLSEGFFVKPTVFADVQVMEAVVMAGHKAVLEPSEAMYLPSTACSHHVTCAYLLTGVVHQAKSWSNVLNMLAQIGRTGKEAVWDAQKPLMFPALQMRAGNEMPMQFAVQLCQDAPLGTTDDSLPEEDSEEELDWWNPGGFSDQEAGYAPDCPCD